MKGLCEQTVKVLQLMEAEGIELNLVMLNVLINAFGTAGRYLEALSVYHHIRDSVKLYHASSISLSVYDILIRFYILFYLNITGFHS